MRCIDAYDVFCLNALVHMMLKCIEPFIVHNNYLLLILDTFLLTSLTCCLFMLHNLSNVFVLHLTRV